MLELKNITAGYGKQTVLDGVTASFEKGKLTSVIGVNGCGKSTLLKSALGILPHARGEISIDGQRLATMSRNDIARRIAYLQQGKSTPDMTVGQMVLHGRFPYLSYPRRYTRRDKALARQAMEVVGIEQLADQPMYSLSGGMRQTAYIAMALAQNTDYILLDEPTAYLDIAHQLALMKLLRSLADEGKGIVAVMHDLPLAFDFSDEILVLDHGKARIQTTPSALCASSDVSEVFNVRIARLSENGRCYVAFSL